MAVTIKGSGKTVLQVKSATKTDKFRTTSTSYVDITGLSVSITPYSSTSTILVVGHVAMAPTSDNTYTLVRLMRNTTSLGVNTDGYGANSVTILSPAGAGTYSQRECPLGNGITFLDSPGTTSAVTYKFQTAAYVSGTTNINCRRSEGGDSCVSTITVMEISGD